MATYDVPSQSYFSDIIFQLFLNLYNRCMSFRSFDILINKYLNIKSKLKGKAREVMEIDGHVTTLEGIRNTLVNNFGDRETLKELFDRLRGITFKTNSV